MENNSHSMLGPSSSHRWLECPPSAKLQENYPNESSSYAELGTQAHALCEYKLNKMLGKVEDEPVLELRDAEMDDCSDGYVAYISEIITSLKDSDSSPIVLVEQRLNFSKYVQDGFGTGDCVIVGNGVLHVVDYKNGTGVEVSAVENPQMMIYALGALDLFDCLYDIEKIVMTIYQPRLSNISTFEMKKAELLEWANNVLVPKAKLAFRRNDKTDHKQAGKSEGVLLSDVGYIKSSIDRIEKTLEKLEEKYDDLHTRIIKVEQKVDDHLKNTAIHKMED